MPRSTLVPLPASATGASGITVTRARWRGPPSRPRTARRSWPSSAMASLPRPVPTRRPRWPRRPGCRSWWRRYRRAVTSARPREPRWRRVPRAKPTRPGRGGAPPATAFGPAVASGYEVTLCWLGDSRAYWLGQPAEESRLLTRDDSVAGGMIAAGLVDEAAAMASPHAHVLTRRLGGEG